MANLPPSVSPRKSEGTSGQTGRPCRQVRGAFLALASAWFCWGLAGCGSSDSLSLADVKGDVSYQGKPVPNATVMFIPQDGSLPAMGTTNATGEFTLRTQGQNGAVPGTHGVTIVAVVDSRVLTAEELDSMSAQQLAAVRRSLIPKKYNNQQSSGLSVQVTHDNKPNTFTFDLKD
ncbi:carboxypeptidase-like regulatory domain-containing protein [Planctomicrobium sp. SH664]|uniref:carboxypeptidase-like regulatory domain-containing protein n=1 Tax=Planctomicrobium sp. SH664 TaxID=3448125 RepID=UPI003F5BFD12